MTFFDSIVSSVNLYFERRRALHELYRMNDRDLTDIGISRGDIPYVVEKNYNPRNYRKH